MAMNNPLPFTSSMLAPISRPTTVPHETDEDEGLKHFEQVSCYAFNINFSLETVWLSLSLTNHYKVSFYSLRRKLFCDCSKTLFPMKLRFTLFTKSSVITFISSSNIHAVVLLETHSYYIYHKVYCAVGLLMAVM